MFSIQMFHILVTAVQSVEVNNFVFKKLDYNQFC